MSAAIFCIIAHPNFVLRMIFFAILIILQIAILVVIRIVATISRFQSGRNSVPRNFFTIKMVQTRDTISLPQSSLIICRISSNIIPKNKISANIKYNQLDIHEFF